MVVPELYRAKFALWRSGEYARIVRTVINPLFLRARAAADPRYWFEGETPPFLANGNIEDWWSKVLTVGINPKTPRSLLHLPPPETDHAYYVHHRDSGYRDPSPYGKTLYSIIAGLRQPISNLSSSAGQVPVDWRNLPADWRRRHAIAMDMVPWHSSKWPGPRLTPARLAYIRDHVDEVQQLFRTLPLKCIIFNGKPWSELLTSNDPDSRLPYDFAAFARIEYHQISRNPVQRGAAVLGYLHGFADQVVPTIILSVFIHQARPPFRSEQLGELGRAIAREFHTRGKPLQIP